MIRPCPGPDYYEKTCTVVDLNKVEMLFDGKYLDLAAHNGGTFHRRLGSNIYPPSILSGRPADAGCRE